MCINVFVLDYYSLCCGCIITVLYLIDIYSKRLKDQQVLEAERIKLERAQVQAEMETKKRLREINLKKQLQDFKEKRQETKTTKSK